jgi:hypothetical protein
MSYFIVRHTVEDYNKWKPAFDEDGKTRAAAGSQGGRCSAAPTTPTTC